MNYAQLNELPPSPPGKTGWPWTEKYAHLPPKMPNGKPWAKISIVTPSYNQGQFIEETIRSVLLQGYPNLEYIIIDGGSTDNSVEIIKKYEPWLAYWISEKDCGQSHAINKGFKRATGGIMAWLNTDDIYAKNTLTKIATKFDISRPQILCGGIGFYDSDSRILPQTMFGATTYQEILKMPRFTLPQPGVFWTKILWELVGPLDESLYFSMDYELWLRIFLKLHERDIITLEDALAYARRHELQKTHTSNLRKISLELNIVRFRHVTSLGKSPLIFLFKCYFDRALRYSHESKGFVRRFILNWLPRKQDINLLVDYIHFLKSLKNAGCTS
ncbi:glycosyltransferase [Candidatus Kuenenia sp.]|uniref:glycosyltransferase family 2 protein n=1 Tax=Candidatus Kuenenia sp. TaxID=2499824 RepID=UPI00321F87CE